MSHLTANQTIHHLSATVPLQSHCATRLKLTVKKSFKNAPLAGFQDRKGTPFEHFRRVLSTNQKPGFRALDQSEASISAKFPASAKFETIQWTVTVPLQSHCVTEDPLETNISRWISIIVNGLPILQFHATWTTPVSLQPLGWHSITASSLDEANRSLPSIEGSGRLARS